MTHTLPKTHFEGTVIHGKKLGRTLGFPTANLSRDEDVEIKSEDYGVYAVTVHVKNHRYRGLMSLGTRPTVTDTDAWNMEVYILDFNEDIYGEGIKMDIVCKLRDELRFNTLDELKGRMHDDLAVIQAMPQALFTLSNS